MQSFKFPEYTQQQWNEFMLAFPPGTLVQGVVTACPIFGVFVQLDELPDVKALLEIIHFRKIEEGLDHRIEYPKDYPSVGSRIQARVLGWSLQPHDVRLT
ncbi:S1 RNA-binding domain-containing protein [Hymenobacter sp. BT491]|uniref:S1 RNA-binding domain-containing protein n=1 Tax=Hymenobacter sp. BT491 TaxID=2766779 RepID=UPI001653A159|nr:S1 RNA-binding domain-containing protein [Hymenobacter sp. BT491]MBC6988316.1 S1 RNA-binding domain-containing protein [Hymenobacter sp. BT491]